MKNVSVIVAVIALILRHAGSQENNVCPTFDDYYTIKNNSKCWYNLAAEYDAHVLAAHEYGKQYCGRAYFEQALKLAEELDHVEAIISAILGPIYPEVIKRMGYPLEEFKVTTVDGYILRMFRIPNTHASNPQARYYPIYLQHGLVATCDSFVALGRDSLAFVLSDAGYDVWLGNYRGNPYSEDHINLTVYDQVYWDHSIDEVALIDLPAMFHTILRYTAPESKVIYIGHSLGTATALMYGSEYPDESKRIVKLFVMLCPAYTLAQMISPYRLLAPFGDFIVDTVRRLKLERIVSQAQELRRLVVPVCTESPELMRYCLQLYNLFYGPRTDLRPEMIPVYFNQVPGGTSIKILNHAADFVKGNFRKYNYNDLNYKYYGTSHPPIYDIDRLEVPVYIVVSGQDWATPEADAINLWNRLPRRAKHGFKKINLDFFNHIDFVFGQHARELVYDPLVKVLDKAIAT